MFILKFIAITSFINFLGSPHVVNALLQPDQPLFEPVQPKSELVKSIYQPCFERDCICSPLITNCSSSEISYFPPNNDFNNSYHSVCIFLVLGENCTIKLSDNFEADFPQIESIAFDASCLSSAGCVHYDGPSFNNTINLVNNTYCKPKTTSSALARSTEIPTTLEPTKSSQSSTTATQGRMCTNVAGDGICETYKRAGVCGYPEFRTICELTCNPACKTTTTTPTPTSTGLLNTCQPSYQKGTNATLTTPGVETCCDVADNCDDLIAIANVTHNGIFETNYDVCYNVTSGLFFSQCVFSCGGCHIEDDKLSGLDYRKDCHDNYDTFTTCIPLLVQHYCGIKCQRKLLANLQLMQAKYHHAPPKRRLSDLSRPVAVERYFGK